MFHLAGLVYPIPPSLSSENRVFGKLREISSEQYSLSSSQEFTCMSGKKQYGIRD